MNVQVGPTVVVLRSLTVTYHSYAVFEARPGHATIAFQRPGTIPREDAVQHERGRPAEGRSDVSTGGRWRGDIDELRHARFSTRYGSVNATTSGTSPLRTVSAMYCLPFTRYVIGLPMA